MKNELCGLEAGGKKHGAYTNAGIVALCEGVLASSVTSLEYAIALRALGSQSITVPLARLPRASPNCCISVSSRSLSNNSIQDDCADTCLHSLLQSGKMAKLE